jgi:transcriptional regulator GlxA family with amidase domain
MRIAVHAFDGITMFHLSVPLLVFGEVTRQGLAEGWKVQVWTEDGHGVRTAEGLRVDEVDGPDVLEDADLLVFPSWHTDFRPTTQELSRMVARAHQRGARVAGLCLGAFPVVDSGVVGERTVVTHWAAASSLVDRGATTTVDASSLYLDHGDVLTSAGTASAIDACLHVVRAELGSAAATTVARHLVVAPHREGGQAQYVERPLPEPEKGGQLGPTLDWALANLDADLGVEALAGHAGMSRRNFNRRFFEVTGATPARWVLGRRLDRARGLLENTDWSIDRVARECGFASTVTFRQNFTSAFSTTPTSYRKRFETF